MRDEREGNAMVKERVARRRGLRPAGRGDKGWRRLVDGEWECWDPEREGFAEWVGRGGGAFLVRPQGACSLCRGRIGGPLEPEFRFRSRQRGIARWDGWMHFECWVKAERLMARQRAAWAAVEVKERDLREAWLSLAADAARAAGMTEIGHAG